MVVVVVVVIAAVVIIILICYFARRKPSTTGSTSQSDKASDGPSTTVLPNSDKGIYVRIVVLYHKILLIHRRIILYCSQRLKNFTINLCFSQN